MALCVGIMVTWRTYGTWLPGDARGYVEKGGVARSGRSGLCADCESRLGHGPVRLSIEMRRVVGNSISEHLRQSGVELFAMAVCSDHVHLVVRESESGIGEIVARCKVQGRKAVKAISGVGEVWAKGYDKQFCFDMESLRARIEYVRGHLE